MVDSVQPEWQQKIEALERKNKLLEEGLHQAERLRQMYDRTAHELKATKLLLVRHSAELAESEQKFMQFFMGVPVALGVVNQSGIITHFNHRFTQVFGYTTDDVPTIQDWWQRAYPDYSYRQQVLASWGAAAAKAAEEGKDIELAGYKVTCKSGAELITEIGGLTFGDNLLATFVDVTARKQAEQILAESESRFREIFNTVNDVIFIHDAITGRIIDVNSRMFEMYGYTREEVFASGPDDMSAGTPPYSSAETGEKMRLACTEGPQTFDWLARARDGHLFWVEVSLRFALIGNQQRILAVIRDITERKQAEEKIRKLNEELEHKMQERTKQLQGAQEELVRKEKLAVLGQVAGSVGHELRNPLGVMNNAVYFLQTVLTDADETTREYLNIIKDEIAASERIVADLLDSVRSQPPHPAAVGVAELVGQTLGKLTLPPSVTVKLDIPATLPALRVDAQQIHQVLRNLISNGVEAMTEGGMLKIRADENRQDGTVSVKVQDSGIGMTPEHLGQLFQPLFTTKARGIGLGLVVVKNLTEANGGTVTVESQVGKGTTFTVTLPSSEL